MSKCPYRVKDWWLAGWLAIYWLLAATAQAQTYDLTVTSQGVSAVSISSTSGHAGTTDYQVSGVTATSGFINFSAPPTWNGATFSHWSGCTDTEWPTCWVQLLPTVIDTRTIVANYTPAPSGNGILYVQSTGASGVPIASSTGHGGTTNYSVTNLSGGTSIQLAAPATQGDTSFEYWEGCDATAGNSGEICALNMPGIYIMVYCESSADAPCPADRKVHAVYGQASLLTVKAEGASSVPIASSTGHGGTTDYSLSGIASGTAVNLSAPLVADNGARFSDWQDCDTTSGENDSTCHVATPTIYCITTPCPQSWQITLKAKYLPPVTHDLTVDASGASGVTIGSSTGHGGTTRYRKSGLVTGTQVELSAPATSAGARFVSWEGCTATTGTSGNLCQVRVDESKTLVAHYESAGLQDASLAIVAPARLQANSRTALTAAVVYPDNSRRNVVPLWSSSNSAVASVSATGILSAGSVTTDTPLTISASYTENGKTVTASQTITITAAPATIASLTVSGGNAVSSGGLLRLGATATYSDGSSRGVAVSGWSVSPASLASINSRGELTAGTVTSDTALTVTASYTEGSLTQTATSTITLKTAPATLDSLGVVLERGSLASGESIGIVAESGYSDGSGKHVKVGWTIQPANIASIADGRLTAGTVSVDTPVILTATYSEGGKTLTAKYAVIVQAKAEAPKLTAEVIATLNAKNEAKLQLWFNSEAGATTRGGASRAGKKFKVYVAAMLPVGPLVGTPTYFILNRSREWNPLAWPLAEFLSGVNTGEWQRIELLDGVDMLLIAGAQILVGYGETEEDMMSNQRYRMVYQVP